MKPYRAFRGVAAGISSFVLSSFALAAPIDIVEMYNANLDHYFITNPTEAAWVDAGNAGEGWVRTGRTFRAESSAAAGYTATCRFYTSGANSHFYAAEGSECSGLRQQNPGNQRLPHLWFFEGHSFYVKTPSSGTCPSGTNPVYRLYNNRAAERDSNHRFTTEPAVINQMQAQGWVLEGVAMCADRDPAYEEVSAPVASNESVTLRTGSGAQLLLPVGAIAPAPGGEFGTTTITFAETSSNSVSVPQDTTLASRVYQLTPAGHVFQTAVAVTLPLTDTPASDEEVLMYLQNDDGTIENMNGVYDAATNSITGQTRHFSRPFAVLGPRPQDTGCLQVDNSSAGPFNGKNACIHSINYLENPAAARGLRFGGGGPYVPGSIDSSCGAGFCNRTGWMLPAGSYNICVESYDRNSMLDHARFKGSQIFNNVRVLPGGSASSFGAFCRSRLGVAHLPNIRPNEACTCDGRVLSPTPGGTGSALEISLRWDAPAGVDLDLHVYEPSGERIYWNHKTSATGGTLDWDNQCNGYENGRTENVSYEAPVSGVYKVEVHYYGKCRSNAPSPINFQVSVTQQGRTSSYQGTLRDGQRQEVTRITVR